MNLLMLLVVGCVAVKIELGGGDVVTVPVAADLEPEETAGVKGPVETPAEATSETVIEVDPVVSDSGGVTEADTGDSAPSIDIAEEVCIGADHCIHLVAGQTVWDGEGSAPWNIIELWMGWDGEPTVYVHGASRRMNGTTRTNIAFAGPDQAALEAMFYGVSGRGQSVMRYCAEGSGFCTIYVELYNEDLGVNGVNLSFSIPHPPRILRARRQWRG